MFEKVKSWAMANPIVAGLVGIGIIVVVVIVYKKFFKKGGRR